MVCIIQFVCKRIIIRYGDSGAQGFHGAPSLDVMLLKQQVFSASGGEPEPQTDFPVCLPPGPSPFANSSSETGGVARQEHVR